MREERQKEREREREREREKVFLLSISRFVNILKLRVLIIMHIGITRSISARRWEGDGLDAGPKLCQSQRR